MANSNHHAGTTTTNQHAEQDAKQDILRDADLQGDTPANEEPAINDALDPTNAGYDEAVLRDAEGGLSEADADEVIEMQRESTPDGNPTLTPSPTARDDEDPTALDESNIAGEAPTQSV